MIHAVALMAAAALHAPAAQAGPADVRASELIGQPVSGVLGEPAGVIAGLLLDVRRYGVHRVLVRVPQQGEDQLAAYPLAALQHGRGLWVVDVRSKIRLPSEERYVRASRVLGQAVEDPTGKRVGELLDVVVSVATGLTRYFMVDFDTREKGGVLPVPHYAVRLHTDRNPTLQADADRRV